MLWIFISSIILLTILAYKHKTIWKKRGAPQKSTTPFLGEMSSIFINRKTVTEMVKDLYKAYPDSRYVGTHHFGTPILIIKDPDLIKRLCIKDYKYFGGHGQFMADAETDYLWTESLFNSFAEKWKKTRSTLCHSFTSNKLKEIFIFMSKSAQECVEYFLEHEKEAEDLELMEVFTRFAFNIISSNVFGLDINSFVDKNNEFFIKARKPLATDGFWNNLKIILMCISPKLSKYVGFHIIDQNLSGYLKKIVRERIKLIESGDETRTSTLSILMKNFEKLNQENCGLQESNEEINKEMTSQLFMFFFAGLESISTSLCFLSYELAVNPDVQKKLRDEIDQCNKNGGFTYESANELTYLNMVISESLRKYALPLTDRICTEPYTIEPELKGEKPLKINVNEGIWIPLYGLHMDPKYYPNPERFDPERFAPENRDKIKVYYPFGLGPRNCIAGRFALLEMKAIVFHLIANFELVPTEKSHIPLKFAKYCMQLKVEGGFWFGLKKRKF